MQLALPNISRFVFANGKKASVVERWVFALGLLCCLLGLLGLLRWGPSEPVSKIRVDAEFDGLTAAEIWPYLQELFGEDLLAVDLPELAERLERHPWIEQVQLRRVWPDSLVVDVTEPEPFAQWLGLRGEEGFVTASGVALEAQGTPDLGMVYQGAADKVDAFLAWQQDFKNVAATQGWQLQKLQRSDYGQWRAYVANKESVQLELRFGEAWDETRWQRFLSAWNGGLKERKDEIAYVDLRYRGGMAVAWTQQQLGLLSVEPKRYFEPNFDSSLWALAPQGV